MDLLDHAGGDEGGLHTEKVCSGQVVIAAHAQSKDIAGLDLRGKLLDLAEGIVALRGDHTVMLKAFFIDDPDGLCLQIRCDSIGLYLDVQLDPALALIQNFFQRGDLGAGVFLAEPAPGVQLPHFIIGQVINVFVPAGTAAQVGVVRHHHNAVLRHLNVQLGTLTAVVNGKLEGGQGVFRCGGGIAAVCRDDRHSAAQHGAQLIVLRQNKVAGGKHEGEQSGTGNGGGQKRPAIGAAGSAVRVCVRFKRYATPQAVIERGNNGALCKGDGAVDEKLEEGKLNGQRGTGQCKHGLCALHPDADDDAVQRQRDGGSQQQRTQQGRNIPPQQQKKCAENARAHMADAFTNRLPQAFVLQKEQRQHQHPADQENQKCGAEGQIKQVIPAVGTNDAHDIFRHCKLGDIIRGKKKIGERDQRGAVDQNEPVLRQKGTTGVQQGGVQQCGQADALALAGKVQSMQQDGTFKQRPEGCQDGDENDAANNGRGGKNIRSIAVAQIVHGSEPQRQGPDLLHQGNEQQIRGKFAEDKNGE